MDLTERISSVLLKIVFIVLGMLLWDGWPAIGQAGSNQALRRTPRERMLAQMRSPDWQVRAEGLLAAMESPEPGVKKAVVGLLGDHDPAVRRLAIGASGVLRIKAATKPLLALLRHRSSDIRQTAANALGELKAAAAVEPLAGLLWDKEMPVRSAAAWALAQIDSKSALKLVPKLLGKTGEKVDLKEHARLRDGIYRLISFARGAEFTELLIVALSSEARPDDRPSTPKWALTRIGPAGVPKILKELEKSPASGLVLLPVLRDIGDKRAVPIIMKYIRDAGKGEPDDPEPAAHLLGVLASECLKACGDSSVQPELIRLLKSSSWEVRQAAVIGLGCVGGRQAAGPLVAALKDTKVEVRQSAVAALRELGNPRTVKALHPMLKSRDIGVCMRTCEALGKIGSSDSVPLLLTAARDPRAEVRSRAAMALGEIGGPAALAVLLAASRDKEPEVREGAALGMWSLRDPRTVPRLAELLDDKALSVRAMAVEALAGSEAKAVVDPLLKVFKNEKDPKLRAHAASGLQAILGTPARQHLIPGLKDRDRSVRRVVYELLVGQARNAVKRRGTVGDENRQ